jgi:hypothetical protein
MMKQAMVAAVVVVLCAAFWFARAESWLRHRLRHPAEARAVRQVCLT